MRTGLEPRAGLEEGNALEKWKEIQEGHLSHGESGVFGLEIKEKCTPEHSLGHT